MISLPRQARDKHRESSSKRRARPFLQGGTAVFRSSGNFMSQRKNAGVTFWVATGCDRLGTRKRVFVAPFYTKMASFYQDGLRTNIEKALKNDDRFPSLGHCSWNADRTEGAVLEWSGKRHFLRHVYIKCICLPRQARDKHRENSQRVMRFSQEYVPRHALLRYLGSETQEDKTEDLSCLVLSFCSFRLPFP